MNDMCLQLDVIEIKDVRFGDSNSIENGILTIDKEGLIEYAKDPLFTDLDFEIARPGESVRIIPVKDVIEPRIKEDGATSFPGIIGDFEGIGEGVTKVLRGCAVVSTGTIVGFQEGLIDMTGPGADYSRYSKLNNIVLIANVEEGIQPAEHETAIREAGLKAAHYVARIAIGVDADYTETFELKEVDPKLPRVGILYMTMAQGLLHDNYVYGIDAKRLHPTLLHPNEILDGVMVNGCCVVAGDKYTTYDHQNSASVLEFYKRHGIDFNFVGVIVVPTYPGLADKRRCCMSAVRMARLLNLDGVGIPEEGGGNPEADLMMMCRDCEANGIKTVLSLGPDGVEEPVADTDPAADAVINVGDCNMFITLPPMETILGDQNQVVRMSGGSEDSVQPDGGVRVTLSIIMGSVNGQGVHNLCSYVY